MNVPKITDQITVDLALTGITRVLRAVADVNDLLADPEKETALTIAAVGALAVAAVVKVLAFNKLPVSEQNISDALERIFQVIRVNSSEAAEATSAYYAANNRAHAPAN